MKIKLKSLINKLNIFEKESKPVIKGWTSGNSDIDKFIKDTMYDAKHSDNYYSHFLEWVPYDRFTSIKQIGVGGFSKVYSATWLDGKSSFYKLNNGRWKKSIPKPMKVTLKRLNGSQNISPEYLNELKVCWNLYIKLEESLLPFYGITKDPETKEFMIIEKYAGQGNLRNILSNNFNKILWKDKIELLCYLALNLKNLHELEYYHKNIHSGNILFYDHYYKKSYILDFGLTGPVKEQKDNVIYGVLPYIAPEVLNGEPYTSSSDIYSFGVIMAELSSGKPPFHDRKHNANLSLEICNGLRPEFGKETPEIYKKLAYRCMNANSNQRPIATQLYEILEIWKDSINCKNFGYKRKEIKAIFEEADKGIPDISTSYKKDPDAVYTSRTFKFSNLPKPVNLSVIASYLNDEENYQNCHVS